MGAESMLMNLWISDANGGKDFNVWALFAILLVTCPYQPLSPSSTIITASVRLVSVRSPC